MESLTADLAVALEGAFMNRLVPCVEEARQFTHPVSGRTLSGSARRDEELPTDWRDEVRREMEACGRYDDLLFDRLPKGRRARWEVRGGALLSRRTEMVLLAGVVHPIRELIRGLSPVPLPVSIAERVLRSDEVDGPPRVVTVLSTSGWRDPERAEWPEGTSVYLVEPAPGDGFRVVGRDDPLPPYCAPESEGDLKARICRYVEEARVDLVLRGLEAAETSRRTGVPVWIVRTAFAQVAVEREFLRVSEERGTVVLRRT